MALTKIDDRGLNTPIDLLDNEQIRLGTGNDLKIYSTGSNSTIAHNGDGDLIISTAAGEKIYFDSTDFNFRNAASDETLIKATENGEVILYWANSPKLATKNAGVQITGQLMNFTTGTAVLLGDNAQLEIGSSNDLKIWHNADGDSYIRNESGNLLIEANGAGDDAIKIVPDGAVELYWDGSKKLETVTGGISVTGDITATGEVICDNVELTGNMCRIKFTDSDNDPDYSLIVNAGVFKIYDSTNDANRLVVNTDGHVDITGNLDVGNSIDVTGDVTATGVIIGTNFQPTGYLKVEDDQILYVGTGNDLQIKHSSSDNNSYITESGSGSLVIKADDLYIQNAAGGHTNILADSDG